MAAAYEKGDRSFCGLQLPEGSRAQRVSTSRGICFDTEILTPLGFPGIGLVSKEGFEPPPLFP